MSWKRKYTIHTKGRKIADLCYTRKSNKGEQNIFIATIIFKDLKIKRLDSNSYTIEVPTIEKRDESLDRLREQIQDILTDLYGKDSELQAY